MTALLDRDVIAWKGLSSLPPTQRARYVESVEGKAGLTALEAERSAMLARTWYVKTPWVARYYDPKAGTYVGDWRQLCITMFTSGCWPCQSVSDIWLANLPTIVDTNGLEKLPLRVDIAQAEALERAGPASEMLVMFRINGHGGRRSDGKILAEQENRSFSKQQAFCKATRVVIVDRGSDSVLLDVPATEAFQGLIHGTPPYPEAWRRSHKPHP